MFSRNRWVWAIVVIAAVTIALLPLASELPDGLERVAEMFEFAERERFLYIAPMRDYSLPWLGGFLGQAVTALAGIVIVVTLVSLLGRSIRKVTKP